MKKKSYIIAVLFGFVLSSGVFASYFLSGISPFNFIEGLELRVYDMRSSLRRSIDAAGKEVAIVAIDDDSLARLGRWPWPRTRIAQMIDLLETAKPKVIGLDILFSEPEQNQGLLEIQSLAAKYEDLLKSKKLQEKKGIDFASEFSAAAVRLDSDTKLRTSLARAGNATLPMFFSTGGTIGAKLEPVPPAVSSSALTAAVQAGGGERSALLEGTKATVPLPSLAEVVQGVGHVNIYPDFDGVLRREYPVIKYGEQFFPSFALELAMRYLGYQSADIKVSPGRFIEMGATNKIPLDESQSTLVSFAGPFQSFRYYSFHEVLNGKVEMSVFKDKIVILGPSASGISTLSLIPISHGLLPSVEFVANVIQNILYLNFIVRPDWAPKAELTAIAVIGLFIMFVLPRLRALIGAILSTLILIALFGAGTFLFVKGQWIKVMYPAFLLVAGYAVITVLRFMVTEKGKELVEASAIETNKMLGLSFQGQGMLDLAFDKFRLCPMDDQMKDLLYNLGLDFERKRQYNKAVAVYGHIAVKDAGYKDIPEKMKVLKQAAEGAVFGGLGGGQKEGTVLISGGASKPTLGRYEIEKELGRGAMGVVYLGKDPKINRMVAIKTMLMDEDTDANAVKETKERFFREAESAGTLNHPNIVRIFDAGEEHDICYIAMELLEGHDLTQYITKAKLLPVETVMEYIAQVAGALDYAHKQGIVHRDIKPANIMLMKDGVVRVTDFGIARITASSKTATGTVMGTPSYMSPEQVGGKKVDGRSDLFSLGVALFEMTTGEKPFKGGEGIGTLLFQIANDPEPEPKSINTALPSCVSKIIHKALKKNPEERYQRGSEMAADLRACILIVKQGAGGGKPRAAEDAVASEIAGAPSVDARATSPVAPVVAGMNVVENTADAAGLEAQPVPAAGDKTSRIPSAEEIAASIVMPPKAAKQTAEIASDETLPPGGLEPARREAVSTSSEAEKTAPGAKKPMNPDETVRIAKPDSFS